MKHLTRGWHLRYGDVEENFKECTRARYGTNKDSEDHHEQQKRCA